MIGAKKRNQNAYICLNLPTQKIPSS